MSHEDPVTGTIHTDHRVATIPHSASQQSGVAGIRRAPDHAALLELIGNQ
ncbi:hypothetical protein [Microbispora sp. NBC_01389]